MFALSYSSPFFIIYIHYIPFFNIFQVLNKKILITDTAAREAVENYENAKIVVNNENAIYEALEKILEKKEEKNDNNTDVRYENNEIIEQIKQLIEG